MTDDEDGRNPIIIEDEALRHGFTQIPNQILRRQDVGPGAKLAFMVLLSYAWQKDSCHPGQQKMADDMGVSDRSVRTYLQELQMAELITVEQRGLGKTNVYTIHRLRPENISGQERKPASGQERKILPTKNTQRKDPKKKMQISTFELPTPMKSVTPVTPEFKTAHPDLWQAGCTGVAEFIRVVGRGLWTDEAMNVSQWQAHHETASQRLEKR